LKVVACAGPTTPSTSPTQHSDPHLAELIDWGVDGIIHDRPDLVRGMLAARGYRLPPAFP